MFVGTVRGRKLSVISFLFVLAVCAAFAAHERLHEMEIAAGGHAPEQHDGVAHDHPGIAPTGPLVTSLLVAVGIVLVTPTLLLSPGHPSAPRHLCAGPPRDSGGRLHDILCVYRV
ncbi:MAG: hypothetical protein HYU52_14280 [Acidobacteria bacterium]|nr:hypothetical protein [Acidobacteriota bacterium]